MRTIRLPRAPDRYDAGDQGEVRRQLERAVLDLSNPPPGTIDGGAIIPGTLPSKSFLRLYRVADWTPVLGNAIQWDGQDYGTDDGRPAETDTVFLTSMGEGTWLFLAQISIKDAPLPLRGRALYLACQLRICANAADVDQRPGEGIA